jgi:D-methionine transport system permease protein
MSLELFLKATIETIYMVLASGFLASIVGIPLGIALFISQQNQKHFIFYHQLAFIVNASRSIPFIILMVAVIPFTRLIAGTSIGTTAAIIPLTLAAIPFLARLIQAALLEISTGLLEAAKAMGASTMQLIRLVLWPEALSGFIHAITITLVNLIGYSAMAGAIGGGGLGDLAIRFGYQRFNAKIMIITIVILVIMVQGIQYLGEQAARMAKKDR